MRINSNFQFEERIGKNVYIINKETKEELLCTDAVEFVARQLYFGEKTKEELICARDQKEIETALSTLKMLGVVEE